MIYSKKQVSRFWNNVAIGAPDACWPWKKSQHSNGYGQVGLRVDSLDRVMKAHKVAWEIHNNKKLSPNVRASHSCDNKLCCNPRHVVVQVAHIAAPKSSAARGENHGRSKLTNAQVRAIKYRLISLSTRELATLHGVSFHTIWDIRKGITWRHV